MEIESINPATGELIQSYREQTSQEVGEIAEQVHKAHRAWKEVPLATRSELLRNLSARLRKEVEQLSELMALEMGKPLDQGRAEIEKCAWVCDYFASEGPQFLQPEEVQLEGARSFVSFAPLGVIMAIMPWNFPFWQVFRAAAPALLGGNAMILKHASNVTGCALAIEDLFRKSNFPPDLFRAVILSSTKLGKLIESPCVQAVTFTGSSRTGAKVASRAAAALKKTVLELGGSDPYVILEDANLEQAAEACVKSRLINSGQSCIAAKRFIVVEPVRRRFQELMLEMMRAQVVGDPMASGITVGPLARGDLRETLQRQVEKSIEAGAKLLLGGKLPEGKGCFYRPTVLTDVKKGMPAFDEETFGPVAAIISARNETDAIEKANDSPYGLGAAIFTKDRDRAEQIAAEQLEAGCCFVNDFVRSDPRLPFGGIKQSGYGRELSYFGLREFLNVKAVVVK